MSQTTNFKLPKPALTDQPNGPIQIGALADAVDTLLVGWFRPRVKQVQRTGVGQSIPDSTGVTMVGFNLVTIQSGASIAYSSGVYTVDFNGVVEVSLFVLWPVVATAHRSRLRILQNGGQAVDGVDTKWVFAGTGGQTGHTIRSVIAVAAGDQISQDVFQDSGASVTTVADGAAFTIRRIA